MPVNKNAMARYCIIDKMLSDPNRDYTTEEIAREVTKKKPVDSPKVTLRMIQKDIKALMYKDTGEDPCLRGVPESMLENGKLKAVFRADVGLRKPAGDLSYTLTDNQTRRVEVLPNTEGHSAYPLLEPGDGSLVTIYNEETGRQQLGTKPMDIVEVSDSYVELRGTSVLAMSPFGLMDPGNEDFGCRIFFSRGIPSGFWLHRYDTGVDYLYASKRYIARKL